LALAEKDFSVISMCNIEHDVYQNIFFIVCLCFAPLTSTVCSKFMQIWSIILFFINLICSTS
jgi:hypothetical protein